MTDQTKSSYAQHVQGQPEPRQTAYGKNLQPQQPQQQPGQGQTVQFQTRQGNMVSVSQPQRGTPANRVPPPTARNNMQPNPNQPQVPNAHPQANQPAPPVRGNTDEQGRLIVLWQPVRAKDSAADLELTDCVIKGLPLEPSQEQDPHSRMAMALLTEILILRDRVQELENSLQKKEE